MTNIKDFLLTEKDEESYFTPQTWEFWRGVIIYFFVFSLVGHWMEIPYCWFMDTAFGIIAEDYAVRVDPLYVPYWVYGIGATALTFIMLPLKVHIVEHRKTLGGAVLEFFLIAVVLCAILETGIGLIINQPDELGVYPFWDNSVLPLNILEQGWLMNDLMLGLVSLLYVWVIFPFCQKALTLAGPRVANGIFVAVLVIFAFICLITYVPGFAPGA